MDETQENETSSSNNADDDNDEYSMENINELLQGFMNEMSSETNEQTAESSVIFEQLLSKVKQLLDNSDNSENLIHQTLPLCDELIDIVEEANFTDTSDLQTCIETITHIGTIFENITSIKDEKFLIREFFFELLDLLSKPQICSCFNNNQHTKTINIEVYKYLTVLLLALATDLAGTAPFIQDDSITRNYTELFSSMYKRVERDLQLGNHTKQQTALDNKITDYILNFFWNLSDRTIMVPWLLGIDLTKAMLECLKVKKLSLNTTRQIISIIHNISRHDDGADELKKFDGLVILKDMQSKYSSVLGNEENLIISMASILLSTPQQIRSDNKRMNKILNQLLQIIIDAAKSENYRDQDTKGFHVSEPLAVFTKLFTDDHSLKYVLNDAETNPRLDVSSKINLFVDLFMKFRDAFEEKNQLEQFTCIALLNILWSISFQDQYETILQKNQNFLKAIRNLASNYNENVVDHYAPRSMESVKKAANGILDNLYEIRDSKTNDIADQQLASDTGDEKPMIMISYAHANDQFCDKILAEIERKRDLCRIWIDRYYLASNEDLWEKIARGIKQSKVVVCLLSQKYYDSKSCRKEATFAIKRNKSIIPVYIGEPGDCDWLEPEIIKSTTFNQKKPVEQWTVDDIHAWFSSHKVPDTLVKLYDFQSAAEIQEYAVKVRTDPEKEFIKYQERYTKNYPGEELEEYVFNRFKKSLFNLPNSKQAKMTTPLSSSQTTTPKSSTCTIL
ncbi:unnamed protein product [Rotaria sp. Silwood2]|nr:unnamed protein product [Rotaria sp. Silwood2]